VRAVIAVVILLVPILVGAGLWIGRSPEPPTPPVSVIAVLPFEVRGSARRTTRWPAACAMS
jgi:hypothetical protein